MPCIKATLTSFSNTHGMYDKLDFLSTKELPLSGAQNFCYCFNISVFGIYEQIQIGQKMFRQHCCAKGFNVFCTLEESIYGIRGRRKSFQVQHNFLCFSFRRLGMQLIVLFLLILVARDPLQLPRM